MFALSQGGDLQVSWRAGENTDCRSPPSECVFLTSTQVVLTLLAQGPPTGGERAAPGQARPTPLLRQVTLWELLLQSGFPLKVRLYPPCVSEVELQIGELRHE